MYTYDSPLSQLFYFRYEEEWLTFIIQGIKRVEQDENGDGWYGDENVRRRFCPNFEEVAAIQDENGDNEERRSIVNIKKMKPCQLTCYMDKINERLRPTDGKDLFASFRKLKEQSDMKK